MLILIPIVSGDRLLPVGAADAGLPSILLLLSLVDMAQHELQHGYVFISVGLNDIFRGTVALP